MNRIQSVLLMHWRYKGVWAVVPLLVLFSSFAVNIGMVALSRMEIESGAVASVHLSLFVAAILACVQLFPFALDHGVRRTDFFVGTSVFTILLSSGFALLLTVLAAVERNMTGLWGEALHFFHQPYWLPRSLPSLFWHHLALMLLLVCSGLFIHAVFARFGRTGLTLLSIGLMVVVTAILILAPEMLSIRWQAIPFSPGWQEFLLFAVLQAAIALLLLRRTTR